MRQTSFDQFSAAEVAIVALYVATGFLAATIFSNILFEQLLLQRASLSVAGCLALAALAKIWFRQKGTRRHPVNFLLLAVAGFIALELISLIY